MPGSGVAVREKRVFCCYRGSYLTHLPSPAALRALVSGPALGSPRLCGLSIPCRESKEASIKSLICGIIRFFIDFFFSFSLRMPPVAFLGTSLGSPRLCGFSIHRVESTKESIIRVFWGNRKKFLDSSLFFPGGAWGRKRSLFILLPPSSGAGGAPGIQGP